MSTVFVVGAGPKAAALAAAVACGANDDVRLVIADPRRAGSHWRGGNGYSDGVQMLCTDAERDVTFPQWPDSRVRRKLHGYSWRAFMEETRSHESWVSRKQRRPRHDDFADYVEWVIRRARSEAPDRIERCDHEVKKLRRVDGRWEVEVTSATTRHWDADGIVLTGPGPAKSSKMPGKPLLGSCVFDARNFWDEDDVHLRALAPVGNVTFAVAGGGGAAAAVALRLARLFERSRKRERPVIKIISSSAALFTRGSSAFEDRLFCDPGIWPELPIDVRRTFLKSVVNGVVWSPVLDELQHHENVVHEYGRVEAIIDDGNGRPVVVVRGAKEAVPPRKEVVNLAVSATGFDPWAMVRLVEGFKATEAEMKLLDEGVDQHLRLVGNGIPENLHVPALACVAQGPAFGSLLALGMTAQRILSCY